MNVLNTILATSKEIREITEEEIQKALEAKFDELFGTLDEDD